MMDGRGQPAQDETASDRPANHGRRGRKLKILIVDCTGVYREALAVALRSVDPACRVETAADLNESIPRIRGLHPDVILISAAMGATVARKIVQAAPQAIHIALGVTNDEKEIIAFAEAGVTGCFLRQGSLNDLLATIRSTPRGKAWESPWVAGMLLRLVKSTAGDRPVASTNLTARELEILRLIDVGRSNKEIAQALSIDVKTVKSHVHNILEKLSVRRRGEAAAQMRALRSEETANGERSSQNHQDDPHLKA